MKWKRTLESSKVTLSCTGEHVGSVARRCSSGGIWEEPDYSQCISKSMLYIQQQVITIIKNDRFISCISRQLIIDIVFPK